MASQPVNPPVVSPSLEAEEVPSAEPPPEVGVSPVASDIGPPAELDPSVAVSEAAPPHPPSATATTNAWRWTAARSRCVGAGIGSLRMGPPGVRESHVAGVVLLRPHASSGG